MDGKDCNCQRYISEIQTCVGVARDLERENAELLAIVRELGEMEPDEENGVPFCWFCADILDKHTDENCLWLRAQAYKT